MLKHLFSADYLFGPTLPGFHLSDKLYFQVGVLLVAIGIALIFFKRASKNPVKKHLLGRWEHLFFTIGLLAALWSGLRYELVRFFSMHIMVLLIYIWGVVWALLIIKFWLKEYKGRRAEHEKEEIKKRYI